MGRQHGRRHIGTHGRSIRRLHGGALGEAGVGRRRSLVALLVGAMALAGCAGDDDAFEGAAAPADEAAAEEPASEPAVEGSADDRSAGLGDDGSGVIDLGIVGRDVIIEMRVVMSSDDIQRTVASITANAAGLGGGVASSEIDYGTDTAEGRVGGYAVLVVKVPPQGVDRLLSGLDDVGVVRSVNQSAQDVTEQLVDLDVRIANARQSVANVREFMQRAEDLTDLVALEGELTRRQTELERLEAQQRNLSERVALSTITIEVVPTASVPEPVVDDPDTIGDAFGTGWDAFVSVLFGIVFAIAVVLPFLVIGGVVAVIVGLAVRRRRAVPDDAPGPDRPPAEAPTVSEDEIATPVG